MTSKITFDWRDPLLLKFQLTDEERMTRDAARGYAQDELMPRYRATFYISARFSDCSSQIVYGYSK